MPIYEYACRQCGAEFEKLVQSQEAVACPGCLSAKVTRRISLVGVRSVGSGGTAVAASPGACCGGGCGCR